MTVVNSGNRFAKKSEDYIAKHASMPKLSNEQKTAKLNQVWAADTDPEKRGAFRRIGQGMVGPIQIKLKYEGIGRNILVEDPLDKGFPMPYEVLDDLGQAYILNQTDAEVKSTPFEGKWVPPTLFRVAAFPFIRKEDTYLLRANIVEHAQEMTREAIMKQEDARLLTLLASAITDYASNAAHVITPDHVVEIGAGNPLDLVDFYDAISRLELHEIEVKRILINPADLRDLYTWDVNVTGMKFKDDITSGKTITEFGEFQIQKSIMVPQGTVLFLPEPNFLGVMPVMYSLDVEENNQIEQFKRGWVMDELIGMLVLNPRGLGAIKKA
jgi:hypothetical protein